MFQGYMVHHFLNGQIDNHVLCIFISDVEEHSIENVMVIYVGNGIIQNGRQNISIIIFYKSLKSPENKALRW